MFLTEFYSFTLLLEGDLDKILDCHSPILLQRCTNLINSGMPNNEYYIVEKGILRSYVSNNEDKQITLDFFLKGDLCFDVSAFMLQHPANIKIIAETDCTLWKVKHVDFVNLFLSIPQFAEWGRQWMTKQLIIAKNRQMSFMAQDASMRYRQLMIEYPEVLANVAQKHIATYLGITNTSLSRLRRMKY